MLVDHHRLDTHCRPNVDGYGALLTDPQAVRALDLEQIRTALAGLVGVTTIRNSKSLS